MRKDLRAKLLRDPTGGIVYSENLDGEGADVLSAACVGWALKVSFPSVVIGLTAQGRASTR